MSSLSLVGLTHFLRSFLPPSTLFPLHVFFRAMFFSSPPSNCFLLLHSNPLLSSSSSGVDKTSLYSSSGSGSGSSEQCQQDRQALHSPSRRLSCLFFSLFHFRSKCDYSDRLRPLARAPSFPRARPLRSLEAASTTLTPSPPSPLLSFALFLVGKARLHFPPPFPPSDVALIPDRPTVR